MNIQYLTLNLNGAGLNPSLLMGSSSSMALNVISILRFPNSSLLIRYVSSWQSQLLPPWLVSLEL